MMMMVMGMGMPHHGQIQDDDHDHEVVVIIASLVVDIHMFARTSLEMIVLNNDPHPKKRDRVNGALHFDSLNPKTHINIFLRFNVKL